MRTAADPAIVKRQQPDLPVPRMGNRYQVRENRREDNGKLPPSGCPIKNGMSLFLCAQRKQGRRSRAGSLAGGCHQPVPEQAAHLGDFGRDDRATEGVARITREVITMVVLRRPEMSQRRDLGHNRVGPDA